MKIPVLEHQAHAGSENERSGDLHEYQVKFISAYQLVKKTSAKRSTPPT
ncbi:hypothetical protein ABZS88_45260 [Streptomyces sp. NPDC005480]